MLRGLFVQNPPGLFRFQINREREGEAQTVQMHGKRSRQSARLIWKWN
jgi:hypothetical protein